MSRVPPARRSLLEVSAAIGPRLLIGVVKGLVLLAVAVGRAGLLPSLRKEPARPSSRCWRRSQLPVAPCRAGRMDYGETRRERPVLRRPGALNSSLGPRCLHRACPRAPSSDCQMRLRSARAPISGQLLPGHGRRRRVERRPGCLGHHPRGAHEALSSASWPRRNGVPIQAPAAPAASTAASPRPLAIPTLVRRPACRCLHDLAGAASRPGPRPPASVPVATSTSNILAASAIRPSHYFNLGR